MKNERYTDLICKGFCRYYKGGKEELVCGGYRFLIENFTLSELQQLVGLYACDPEIKHDLPATDGDLYALVCAGCDFRVDGCDYADNRSGPPCGGYQLINCLVRS